MATGRLSDARREAICAWVTANGIHPKDVPENSAFSTRTDHEGRQFLRFDAVLRDPETGNILADPQGGPPLTEMREVPLVVEPPGAWPE
ncbi:hypothetical protein [Streptomyces capuensis]|uniref:hypothetical protein n=1 Tax=Streptomyces capuensis TaxID=1464056 RepID=UPI0004C25706|nr:hypothetical protein [Streptomyces capuensis]